MYSVLLSFIKIHLFYKTAHVPCIQFGQFGHIYTSVILLFCRYLKTHLLLWIWGSGRDLEPSQFGLFNFMRIKMSLKRGRGLLNHKC